MADLLNMAESFKARLVAEERRAASELVRAYGQAYLRIQERVTAVTAEIDDARAKGEIISSSFLYERDRLRNLQIEIEREMRRFSQFATERVTGEQGRAVETASADAQRLLEASFGSRPPFASRPGSLNSEAVERMVGFAGDRMPLRTLFDRIGPEVGKRVAGELVSGVAEGAHARVIAARVRQASGIGLSRALTISRTETLRAYRAATLDAYDSSGVVLRWRWAATLTARTCGVCWAMHGREFSTKVKMSTHVNCRCALIPVTVNTPPAETGVQAFNELEPGVQRAILGAQKYEAFRDGKFGLEDLAGERRSAEWGMTRYERSLKELLG